MIWNKVPRVPVLVEGHLNPYDSILCRPYLDINLNFLHLHRLGKRAGRYKRPYAARPGPAELALGWRGWQNCGELYGIR
jgi:hypothetical protein